MNDLEIIKQLEYKLNINFESKFVYNNELEEELYLHHWYLFDDYNTSAFVEYHNKIVIGLKITNNHIDIDTLNLIFRLEEIRFLDLSNNKIKEIPNSIENLINLFVFNISHNEIEKIDNSLFMLHQFEYLNLRNNNLKILSKEILEIINNKGEIDVSNNQIKEIATDIDSLDLPIIYLDENPITSNLKEIEYFELDSKLLNLLLSIQKKELKPLKEAKILVLGDERVGKTSIINRIVKNKFDIEQGSTQGIDIQNHYLSNDIKVNIWDFAGQEITHQTHQFFLSTRSLYLFVLDAQKEDNDSAIYDWLEVIKSNGGDSPIIIVANKYDLNRGYSFDVNRYKKYSNIIDIIYVSAKDNINIDKLIESIEKNISELKHVKDLFPKDWFEVKKVLEQFSEEKTDFIESGKFYDICEENGIDKESEQEDLLKILHAIGTVVSYENNNKLTIINPIWITNAVYKIIRSEFLNQDAILHKKTFSKIFKNDERYKKRHYQWIMDLLVQFELAFRLDENRVLIPSKLPPNEPDFDITPFQQGLNLRYEYKRRLKKSFISQFMVKMSDEIDMSLETPYWQRGVFLKYGNCKTVVISEEEKNIITISISTQDIGGREFLSNIRREFKKINRNVEVEEKVPLHYQNNIIDYIDYEELVLFEKEKEEFIPKGVKIEGKSQILKFKISDLLFGYDEMIDKSERIDTRPLIITEGKTDWKHLKKVLERFQKDGFYQNLDVQFEEYEDTKMGDSELDRMVQTYCKTKQSKKHIFMFDRDNNNYIKKYAKQEFNNHGNNVYSFCIPKISNELNKICIEFYYKKKDLITKDKNGKRIFLGNEFYPNGNSKCGIYITPKRQTKELDILDRDKEVYLRDDIEWKNNIALSKNDFTNNIINDVKGFNNFDIENFKLIFDVIEKIIRKQT